MLDVAWRPSFAGGCFVRLAAINNAHEMTGQNDHLNCLNRVSERDVSMAERVAIVPHRSSEEIGHSLALTLWPRLVAEWPSIRMESLAHQRDSHVGRW